METVRCSARTLLMIWSKQKHFNCACRIQAFQYPNPFVGAITDKYELPIDCKVSIKVYEVMCGYIG